MSEKCTKTPIKVHYINNYVYTNRYKSDLKLFIGKLVYESMLLIGKK